MFFHFILLKINFFNLNIALPFLTFLIILNELYHIAFCLLQFLHYHYYFIFIFHLFLLLNELHSIPLILIVLLFIFLLLFFNLDKLYLIYFIVLAEEKFIFNKILFQINLNIKKQINNYFIFGNLTKN